MKVGKELSYRCPSCNHEKKKLSINIDKDVYKCWICDLRGKKVFYLIRRYGNKKLQKEWIKHEKEDFDISDFDNIFFESEKQKKQEINLPSDYTPLIKKKLKKHAEPALKYILSRGLTTKDVGIWKIGYSRSGDYGGRIIVPSFNTEGELDFFIGRTYTKHFFKYKNPQKNLGLIFNEIYIDWRKDIVLVEGIFDAIKAGYNSIPLLGSTIVERSRLFQQIVKNGCRVYLALDKDASKKETYIVKKMLDYDVDVFKVSLGEHLDPGSMTKKQFEEKKASAVQINSLFELKTNQLKNNNF